MYDAFPYQRFGIQRGRVERVSANVFAPGEVLGPVQLQEPVYRAVVRLDAQEVRAFGEPKALQPGMMLRADIMLDQRRIIDIVLDPLRAASQRM